MSPMQDILFRRLGLDPKHAEQQLRDFRVCIVPTAPLNPELLRQALEDWQMAVVEEEAHLTIAVADAYQASPDLDDLVRRCQQNKKPCLLIKPTGVEVWIGPLIAFEECWACTKNQLGLQNPLSALLETSPNYSHQGSLRPPLAHNQSTLAFSYHLTAAAVVQYALSHTDQRLTRTILSFNVATLEQANHPLQNLVPCAVCQPSQHEHAISAVPALDRPLDETSRLSSIAMLQDTLGKIEQVSSPITGIISKRAYIPTPYAEGLFYISAALYPQFLKDALPQVEFFSQAQSSACARSRLEADVSAGAEAIERFSCAYQGYEPFERGTYQQMLPEAIHPNKIFCFSKTQYAEREHTNPDISSGASFVPEYLEEDIKIDWCQIQSLTHQGRSRWVPAAFCYYGFPQGKRVFALPDGHGVAAGPSLAFCLQKGLYEIIEKEAVGMWHYNQLIKQEIDFTSFQEPLFEHIYDVHDALQRQLSILDISTDLPLYVFAAISYDDRAGNVILGFGAHHSPKAAIRSAMLECCQMLPNVVSNHADEANEAVIPFQSQHLPDRSRACLRCENFSDQPSISSLQELILQLSKIDIEVLFQDVTRPGIGLHAARVIVPGLRPWYRRLGPGRLYTVPVEQHELPEARREEAMNPVEITF